MKITEKLKVALKSILSIKLAEIETDKGILIYDGEELTVGLDVFTKDENGEIVTAEDGIYVFDIYTITVKDGKVENIEENETEEIEETDVKETETVEMEIVEEPIENPIEEVVEEVTETIIPTEKLEEIFNTLTELYNKVIELEGKVAVMEERLTKIEAEPIAEPIVEETVIENNKETKMSKLKYLKK